MMIPFESVVMIEICRYFFTHIVEGDYHLYHEGSGNLVKVQNPAIIEELGHIKYLFFDKTGTMTQNKLEFREMRVTKKADMKLTEHERNKANFDSSLMMPNLIHWEFKQLPPSLELDDMIRCILLCHECVRLEEKVIFKKDFEEEEYEAFSAVKSKKEIKKTLRAKERHVSTIETSKYNLAGKSHDELVLINLVEDKYESRFVSRIGSDIKIAIRG